MSFDVAARLAQGRTAVANTQVYVDGCRAVGYQNVDLTTRGGQVDEWYATEDGLDLAALDADCATLLAAAGTAAEVLRIERAGMAVMASAWSGDSGGLASEFVERHCSAGATMVDAMRSAAETCTALRDRLWVLINGKVDTATAIVAQPVTGLMLAHMIGWSLKEGWIVLSIALYILAGAFWLPVVWIQMRLRDLATKAAETGAPLPADYHRLFRIWFASGFPAFGAVLAIIWLMLARPRFSLW